MKRLWVILFVLPLFAQETKKEDSFIQKMENKAPIPHPKQSTGSMAIGPYRCRNTGLLPVIMR